MAHGHTAEVLHRFSSDDADMVVVRAEWTHGIYGTREREVFTVWLPAVGESWAVDATGFARQLPDAETDAVWAAVRRAVDRELAG